MWRTILQHVKQTFRIKELPLSFLIPTLPATALAIKGTTTSGRPVHKIRLGIWAPTSGSMGEPKLEMDKGNHWYRTKPMKYYSPIGTDSNYNGCDGWEIHKLNVWWISYTKAQQQDAFTRCSGSFKKSTIWMNSFGPVKAAVQPASKQECLFLSQQHAADAVHKLSKERFTKKGP